MLKLPEHNDGFMCKTMRKLFVSWCCRVNKKYLYNTLQWVFVASLKFCLFTIISGKHERPNEGCYCQPLQASSYISMIASTFGEFAGRHSSRFIHWIFLHFFFADSVLLLWHSRWHKGWFMSCGLIYSDSKKYIITLANIIINNVLFLHILWS